MKWRRKKWKRKQASNTTNFFVFLYIKKHEKYNQRFFVEMPETKKNKLPDFILQTHEAINTLNQSKIFAGLMIIILNVSSKFITVRFSKTIEAYLKNTFSRNILVYAICWMGTRDIYVAAFMTVMFVFIFDYLLNEESAFCCLTEGFKEKYTSLSGSDTPTEIEIKNSIDVLKRATAGLENLAKWNEMRAKEGMIDRQKTDPFVEEQSLLLKEPIVKKTPPTSFAPVGFSAMEVKLNPTLETRSTN